MTGERAPYGSVKAAKEVRDLLRFMDHRTKQVSDAREISTLAQVKRKGLVGKSVVIRGCYSFSLEGVLEEVKAGRLYIRLEKKRLPVEADDVMFMVEAPKA